MYNSILDKILLLKDDELREYIECRKIVLESNGYSQNVTNLNSVHDGYLLERTEIHISKDSLLSYNLMGIDYYEYIEFLKEQEVSSDDLSKLIIVTGMYVCNYFKLSVTEPYKEKRNETIFNEYVKMGKTNALDMIASLDRPSINIFRDNGQGACLEHSLLMQQLLSFVGVDLTMLILYGYKQSDKKLLGHVVNVIHFGNMQHLYYDLVYKEVISDNDSLILNPNVMSISDNSYKKIISGNEKLVVNCTNVLEKNKFETFHFYVASDKSLYKIKKETDKESKWVIRIKRKIKK